MATKTILSLLLTISFMTVSNAQKNKLSQLRNSYCNNNCEFYHENLNFRNALLNLPPAPPEPKTKEDSLVSFFKIPVKERTMLFPFSKYDSVYVITPKYHVDKEPRNYIKTKFHDSKTVVTQEQLNKISDILFNHFLIKYDNITIRPYKITGCNSIEDTYPKIILLFVKNGKKKDYIAFPSQIFRRTSFTNKELEGLDLCAEKEKKIMEMFGVNLEEPSGDEVLEDEPGILRDEYKEN
ncbi:MULTISPECIES: hypothetical protein [Flavobacterium]|uniref:Uncharacterized protein n=1 Tax=Flavobacterium lipolyticum TaxID=2893754 RepID=A0ABS8LV78_9FLAO|nr:MULTISPECIES: hypothetical protein [unclassified Flavobacterium]MCC9016468.1 hypothetical protein [Flavobacterium sp. F-126]